MTKFIIFARAHAYNWWNMFAYHINVELWINWSSLNSCSALFRLKNIVLIFFLRDILIIFSICCSFQKKVIVAAVEIILGNCLKQRKHANPIPPKYQLCICKRCNTTVCFHMRVLMIEIRKFKWFPSFRIHHATRESSLWLGFSVSQLQMITGAKSICFW